jgi:hypothetical protein
MYSRPQESQIGKTKYIFIMCFVCILGGFMFSMSMIGGISEASKVYSLETHGDRTNGEVIDIFRSGFGRRASFYPVVQFQTSDNRSVVFKETFDFKWPGFKRGDRVEVLYDTNNPEGWAIIDAGFWGNLWRSLFPFLACGFILAVSGIFIISTRRQYFVQSTK